MKLIRGEQIDKEDVIALTRFWMPLADGLANGAVTDLDKEFAGHMKFVVNQCLQRVKETGYSKQTAERVGKLFVRLYKVYQAYKQKGKQYTVGEWMTTFMGLREEALKAAGGSNA